MGSHCRPVGSWMVISMLHMLGTVYQWYVTAFSSGLWNIPTPINKVLDSRVVQMHVKIDTLFKQWWLPKQHPAAGRMLAAGLRSCASDQASTYTTTHPSKATLVSWQNRLKSGMALCCLQWWEQVLSMRVMDVDVYGVDLVSVSLRSAFAHDIQAPPQASWCGGPSVTTRGYIWCFSRVKWTVSATLHKLLTPCYCHFLDRKVMCFFRRTTHVNIRLLWRNVLFVVYKNCAGQQDPQICRQLKTY